MTVDNTQPMLDVMALKDLLIKRHLSAMARLFRSRNILRVSLK
jgi:hypothetical protein